jgi:mRNA interferase RelE/StbE
MAKKVTAYAFSRRFKKEYQALPKTVQKAFDDKLALLLRNTLHPSLRVKRIQGAKGQWEGSITRNYRFTFEWQGDEVLFRAIGTHDILEGLH